MENKSSSERAVRAAEIQNLPAKHIELGGPMDKKTAETIARNFSTMTNVNDGRKALLPIGTVGKILRHSGFDLSRIIKNIPELYETSLFGWSELEIPKEGHKTHSNIKEYHHYVNKFTDGDREYYVRFTVTEMKGYSDESRQNIIHSAAVSDIAIYKKGADSQRIRLEVPGGASSTPFADRKLQELFDLSANPGNPEDVTKTRNPAGLSSHAGADGLDTEKADRTRQGSIMATIQKRLAEQLSNP
jgi:hypothetical protein